jgi:hypothetical protein
MPLVELWLPIVAGAAGVFVASALLWMCLPIHKKDYVPLKDDAALQRALAEQGLGPGRYMFPNCMGPDGKPIDARNLSGPWGCLCIAKGVPNMGKMLGLWFVNALVVSALVGYLASLALPAGAAFGPAFRVAGSATLLAYGAGVLPRAIWEGLPWRSVPGAFLDAVVYSVITGVLFAVLWP